MKKLFRLRKTKLCSINIILRAMVNVVTERNIFYKTGEPNKDNQINQTIYLIK